MTITELLIKHEGMRLKPYKDSVGKVTIGIGRNLDDNGISKEEALYLLRNDIDAAVADCNRLLDFFKDLSPIRQMVMIDMIFNIGPAGLMRFVNTLAAIRSKDWKGAADGMLRSKWAQQVGKRAHRLAYMKLADKFPDW